MFYLIGPSKNIYAVIQVLLLMIVFRVQTLLSVIYDMIYKRLCNLSTKVNWHFHDIVNIYQIYQNKTKDLEKAAGCGFKTKVTLNVNKLSDVIFGGIDQTCPNENYQRKTPLCRNMENFF